MRYSALIQILIGLIVFLSISSPALSGANVSTNLTHGSAWTNGDWLQLLLSPATNLAGSISYIIFLGIIIGALYIKSKHTIMITIIGIILSGTVISLIPKEYHGYIVILIALAIAAMIYRSVYRNE